MEAAPFAIIDESEIHIQLGAFENINRIWVLLSLGRKCLPKTAIKKEPEVIQVEKLVGDAVETDGPHKSALEQISATELLLDLATDNTIDVFNQNP